MGKKEVKKILKEVATQAVLICPDIPNEDYYARQICQLFPKTKDNPDGYEPKPDEYMPSGDDPMVEKQEERFNEIVNQLGKKADNLIKEAGYSLETDAVSYTKGVLEGRAGYVRLGDIKAIYKDAGDLRELERQLR